MERLRDLIGPLERHRVAVLGLSFKPGTDDLRDAPALRLVRALLAEACLVRAHDPMVKEPVPLRHGGRGGEGWMPASEETGTAAELLPKRLSLAALRRTVADCRACPLWRDATQIVFGEGRRGSRIILVGEKPGDREDLAGRPFVGPAGRPLDRSLAEAGIDRRDANVTNVVKHLKFERRRKRRIHKRPTADEIRACRPWLEGELEVVRPEVIVTLGATAAQALLGRGFRLTHHRGDSTPTSACR